MQKLPIGIQNFENIRLKNYLYVDKTKQILNLIENGECYFLSRPRRFGKSLTISTLEAMFKGKSELFKGLYAEEWVKEQAKHPNPVITLDMSGLGDYTNISELRSALIYIVKNSIKQYKLNISYDENINNNAGLVFFQIINELSEKLGKVVILIDEYDKPITDNINNLEKANEIREFFRKFYGILKNSTIIDNVHFVFITGVSKFSKAGVFSCLNNLNDISMDDKYGDIVGYTQQELEDNFSDWIEITAQKKSMNKKELLDKIKEYYDGFSFDGITKVYNPFSVLNFFDKGNFYNYWYTSATPSFLAKYLKKHEVKRPDLYRNKEVAINFADAREIETASVESFLYQTGYLTIKEKDDCLITLDYPNEEVSSSMAGLYLENMYNIEEYATLGNRIWKSLKVGNIENVVELFNQALKPIPYDDYSENKEKNIKNSESERGEYWYRSLFMMLLNATGLTAYPEPHDFQGRSDIVIQFENHIIIIEFKFAKTSSDVEKMKKQGEEQVTQYAETYANTNKKIITAVFVADDEKRQIVV